MRSTIAPSTSAAARALFACAALSLVACGGKTSTDDAADAAASGDGAADSPAADGALDADLAACDGPGECVLAGNGCCGTCGEPSLSDFTAVNEEDLDAFRARACPDPADAACPKCATRIEKSLMAFCTAGRCTGVDLRADPLSACTSDADCVLRTAECCECGGDVANPVALNAANLAAFAAAVCKPSSTCAECAPIYPAELRAACDPATKHCVVMR